MITVVNSTLVIRFIQFHCSREKLAHIVELFNKQQMSLFLENLIEEMG